MLLGKSANLLDRALQVLIRAINSIGLVFLIAMMLLTTVDVIMRYVFTSPIMGSYELTQLMMTVLVAFTLAFTQLHKGHINIDVLISRFNPKVQEAIYSAVYTLATGIFALVTWQSIIYAQSLYQSNHSTSALNIPIFPFVYLVAFGGAMLCITYIRDLVQHLNKLMSGNKKRSILGLLIAVSAMLIICSPLWGRDLLWDMSPAAAGFFGLALLVVLLFSGMEIGVVMALVGFVGFAYITGISPALTSMRPTAHSTMASYSLSVVPLFVLMGTFCFHSGMSRDLYFAVYRWLGHLPGGLAMATVGACAGFAAVCGSSIATVATMGTVALPEMKRYGYDIKLATGCISAAGSIGILIPPSVILVIYGVLTEQSIGKLFVAGFIPGILEALFYIITIYILCRMNPQMGPRGQRSNLKEKMLSIKGGAPVLALFVLVIGGIYTGVFTPTEAAGVGAFGAFLFALGKRTLTWQNFTESLIDTGKTTAMTFLILIGSAILGYFLAISRLPFELATFMSALPVDRYVILIAILLVYLILGAIMSSLAMIVLTVPIFFPVILALDFDPLWFGILIVRMVEIGQITPPIGINVFVMKGIAKDTTMYTIFRGILPFLIADFCHVALLISIPQISLFLPNLMK